MVLVEWVVDQRCWFVCLDVKSNEDDGFQVVRESRTFCTTPIPALEARYSLQHIGVSLSPLTDTIDPVGVCFRGLVNPSTPQGNPITLNRHHSPYSL
jgi:hypothetical protein